MAERVDVKCRNLSKYLDDLPGCSKEVIEAAAGHVSRKMMEHYSHIRMQAKRKALDELPPVAVLNSAGDAGTVRLTIN